MNFPEKTAMQKNVTHYCLLRKFFRNYYFNYKGVVDNWRCQSLPYGLNEKEEKLDKNK